MFIKPEIAELPDLRRKNVHTITQAEADGFFRILVSAQGQWMKFFEEPATTTKEQDLYRNRARNYIHCAPMRKYRDQIEFTTRYVDGVVLGFARIK